MGLSTNTYPYTGGKQQFSATFADGYIEQSHVTAYIAGDLDGLGEQVYLNFTWTSENQILVNDVLSVGDEVTVERTVPKDSVLVDLDANGAITREGLARNDRQALHAVHEVIDGRIDISLLATVRALVAEVNALTATATETAGAWDASTGAFPTVRGQGGPVQNGDTFFVQDGGAGVVDGQPQFEVGQRITALIDNPSSTTYEGNWERANTIAILEPITARVENLEQVLENLEQAAENLGLISLKDFGAVGDGVANDTTAWDTFQAAEGYKFVPAGEYLVNGSIKRFDQGCYGNGEFLDADSAWDQPLGDRERNSIIVHRNDIDANATLVSPIIKTQTHVDFERNSPAGSFKHVVGAYHEATYDGFYNTQADTNQNFTVTGAAVLNRMAGLFGGLAHLAYCEDVDRTVNPDIETMGGSKNGCSFMRFTKRGLYEDGGYMFGLEVYGLNSANEATDVPYFNDDTYGFTTWTSCLKLTVGSSGAPISSGMFTSGLNTKHGMWNGLVIGASSFRINNDGDGVPGTVGINLASWREARGWADIGVKFRRANRHLWFREGAKVQSELTRFMNKDGACGVAIEAATGSNPYLHFRRQNTSNDGGFSPTTTTLAQIDATPTVAVIQHNSTSTAAEVRVVAGSGAVESTYSFTTARFAPSTSDDNTKALGSPTRRWSQVYAGNGTINTSDERDKTDIQELADAEMRVAKAVKKLIRKYRWKSSVDEKGDAARWHFGVMAQDVVAAFAAEGLDAHEYGIVCHDKWDHEPEQVHVNKISVQPAKYEQVLVTPEMEVEVSAAEYDDDGNLVKEAVFESQQAEYQDGEIIEPEQFEEVRTVTPAVEAGERYGVRYSELMAFMIAAL